MLRDSVTQWIRAAENNDDSAAKALFDRYFHRVLALARRKLSSNSRRVADEEDIAITAFQACLVRIGSEKFAPLKDRGEFWGLLARITDRKVYDALRKHLSVKRGAGRVRGESVFICPDGEQSGAGIAAIPDETANQELAVHFAEEYQRLMGLLDDDLRQAARMVLAGYNTAEIAHHTDRTQRTVQRRVRMILDTWNREFDGFGDDSLQEKAA